jgi:hypothetical protein
MSLSLLKLMWAGLWPIFEPIVKILLSEVGREVLKHAQVYVAWAEGAINGTGTKKHAAVVLYIKEEMGAKLKNFKDSWIDVVIKLLVMVMNIKAGRPA